MLTGREIEQQGIVNPGDALDPRQVQPNGIDLTLDALWRIAGEGHLGIDDADRHIPPRDPVIFGDDGWVTLPAATYGLRFREAVALPLDRGGLAFPRSSLLRMGAYIPTAVWDAGYAGRAESLLVVTASGIRIQRGARVAQLVIFRLAEPAPAYAGQYQGENL